MYKTFSLVVAMAPGRFVGGWGNFLGVVTSSRLCEAERSMSPRTFA